MRRYQVLRTERPAYRRGRVYSVPWWLVIDYVPTPDAQARGERAVVRDAAPTRREAYRLASELNRLAGGPSRGAPEPPNPNRQGEPNR